MLIFKLLVIAIVSFVVVELMSYFLLTISRGDTRLLIRVLKILVTTFLALFLFGLL